MEVLRPTWCEIDLGAVAQNMATLRDIAGPIETYVCLKSDAMGCGDIAVGRTVEAAGATGVAFGNVERAVAARTAGLRLPILLYPACLPTDAPALEHHRLVATISTLDDVRAWSAHARGLDVFLKLDGGGFRAGALPHDAVAVARAIVESPTLRLAGVYGHPMASYGVVDEGYTTSQIAACMKAIDGIEKAGIVAPVRMVASSEIILNHPEADLTAINPGRLILGHPFESIAERARTWRHALVGLRSRLVMVKSLADTADLPPSPILPLRDNMRIGLIPLGATDGYPARTAEGATVLVRGRRTRIIGPTHTELLRVDLTDIEDAEIGDEVVLLGSSGDETITVEDLSRYWQLHVARLYSTVGKSVRRVYI